MSYSEEIMAAPVRKTENTALLLFFEEPIIEIAKC
jgi:hypothetical protein